MKPHIVIDARLYGPKHTGIGRYTKNLLLALTKLPDFPKYNFTIIIYPELLDEAKRDLGNCFNYVPTNIKHYSFSEQFSFPLLLRRLHPDLVHFTNSYKPPLYFGRSVITVHDLIRHFYRGIDTSTRHPFLYWPKYLAFILLTNFTIKHNYLIVPSNFWRDYILNTFHISPAKIITTYEATDPKFLSTTTSSLSQPKDYLIYTGNLYPHKNFEVILKALQQLPEIKLKVIAARSVFSDRLKRLTRHYHLNSQVEQLGFVKDADFRKIYSQALCLVHPSLMEGFSLTGLEAMALNCPVISSNSSCLPEIYQDAVLYFNPTSSSELVDQINNLKNHSTLRQQLIKKGRQLLQKYSWDLTAKKTLKIYQQCLN